MKDYESIIITLAKKKKAYERDLLMYRNVVKDAKEKIAKIEKRIILINTAIGES